MGLIEPNIELLRPRTLPNGLRYTELLFGVQKDRVHVSSAKLTLSYAHEILMIARTNPLDVFVTVLHDLKSLHDMSFYDWLVDYSGSVRQDPRVFVDLIYKYLRSNVVNIEEYHEPEWVAKSRGDTRYVS